MTACSVLLVTANVGSIFEDPDLLLCSWIQQFLCAVHRLRPQFLALHCQEVGGKNYEQSMCHVDRFVRSLIDSQELADFHHFRIFLDEDFTSTAKFTALGNLYFIHRSIPSCQIWDFEQKEFTDAFGQQIFSGNIESVPCKEKDKFPKDYFPDYPSYYTKVRRDALTYTLDRIEQDEFETVPFFVFGDFNFRLNTGQVVRKITKNISPTHVKHEESESTERILYQNASDENPFLTVEKKVFDLINQEDVFYVGDNRHWLLEDDSELDCFKGRLLEQEIKFPPSYPFTEDMCGTTYMKTRCPSWCDRILFSHPAKALISDNEFCPTEYQMLGADVPMGDHKPIFLSFYLNSGNACLHTHGDDVKEEHVTPEPELRARVNSNPPIPRPQTKPEARRVFSLHQNEKSTDSRSPQWVHATQTVLRALRVRQSLAGSSEQSEQKQREARLSSRLTSHHSSSSEEWYSELQLLSESADGKADDRLSAHSAPQPQLQVPSTEKQTEGEDKEAATSANFLAEDLVPEARDSAGLSERKDHKRRKRCCLRCNMT